MTGRRAPLVAALVAVAVHAPALGHPFVYDDIRLGDASPLRSLAGLRNLLTSTRPLTAFSVALDRLLGGGGPLAFRVTSLLLHAVAAAFVVVIARALAPPAHRRDAPLVAGLLFAAHPLTVEAVGYASARADLLVGVGLLAALAAFLRLRHPGSGPGALIACLAAIGFAGASKETGAAVPLVLLLADRALPSDEDARTRRRRLLGFHLPLLGLIVAAAVWRLSRHLALEGGHAPDAGHFLSIAIALATYLRLALVPVGLSVYHALPSGPLVAALSLATLAALVALVAARAPGWLRLGAGWFLLVLLPSTLVKLGELIAEHRAYAGLPGLVIAAAIALAVVAERRVPNTPARIALFALPIALFAGLSLARHRVWSSPISLWADATRSAPSSWDPWYALGDARRAAGDCPGAVSAYDTAIALSPAHDTRAHQNRAICRSALGDLAGAEADLTLVRERRPSDAGAAFNLGLVVERRGRPSEARALYDAALAIDPKHAAARRGRDRLASTPP